MRQFVPMTDELLYRAGGPPGQLVPYRAGLNCWHALGPDGVYHFYDGAADASVAPPQYARVDAADAAPLISAPLAQPAGFRTDSASICR